MGFQIYLWPRTTLTFDLLTPELDRFMRLPRGQLVPIGIKVGSFVFRVSCSQFVGGTKSFQQLKWPLLTRNLVIANRSRIICAHKVTTVSRSLKWPSKITQGHQKCHDSTYDFRLPFHINYGFILYFVSKILPDIGIKSLTLYIPSVFNAAAGGEWPRRNFAQMLSIAKTRIMELLYAEESMMPF